MSAEVQPQTASETIRPKDRGALLQSLRAGVVPKSGQHLVQVGRLPELDALLGDIRRISEGGSAFRIIVGEYGAGKTFFLNLIRAIAQEKRLVTLHADLNPDRRLQASGGQARLLYAELIKNMGTRAKPDGGALKGVVEKFISTARSEAENCGIPVQQVLDEKLGSLSEMVGGYDFAEVIKAYCRGFEEGGSQLTTDAIRWLRGEFQAKTDARKALNVRSIVEDAALYDQLKLLARFVRLAGYKGLLVCLDEMVNLYKISNTQARNANYEQILRILNDSFQGSAEGIGFILGGTPEFLLDTRRGLYSYEALQSRLTENSFAQGGLVDLSGPVIRLQSLTPEEFYLLLEKIRHVFASGDPDRNLLPDAGIHAFMEHCAKRLGDQYFRTPRNIITGFINLLAVLEQNPNVRWETLLGQMEIAPDSEGPHAGRGTAGTDAPQESDDDGLQSFQL